MHDMMGPQSSYAGGVMASDRILKINTTTVPFWAQL
jgi:hypothetical protein